MVLKKFNFSLLSETIWINKTNVQFAMGIMVANLFSIYYWLCIQPATVEAMFTLKWIDFFSFRNLIFFNLFVSSSAQCVCLIGSLWSRTRISEVDGNGSVCFAGVYCACIKWDKICRWRFLIGRKTANSCIWSMGGRKGERIVCWKGERVFYWRYFVGQWVTKWLISCGTPSEE